MPPNDPLISKSWFTRYWAELLIPVVLIVATAILVVDNKISKDCAVIIDVITAALSMSVVLLKGHLDSVGSDLARMAKRYHDAGLREEQITAILASLSGKEAEHAVQIFDTALDRIKQITQGKLVLDANAYFIDLVDTMHSIEKNSKVLAVNSISMLRWTEDPRQRKYFQANIEASRKGVQIHRIFVVDKSEMISDAGERIRQAIIDQKNNGIRVDIVWSTSISQYPELHDDFTLFDGPGKLFKDEHDPLDPTRVHKATKIWDAQQVEKHRRIFQALHGWSIDQVEIDGFLLKAVGAN